MYVKVKFILYEGLHIWKPKINHQATINVV
jgi:hypothetical protein